MSGDGIDHARLTSAMLAAAEGISKFAKAEADRQARARVTPHRYDRVHWLSVCFDCAWPESHEIHTLEAS